MGRNLLLGIAATFVVSPLATVGADDVEHIHRVGDLNTPSVYQLSAADGSHAVVTIPPGHTTIRIARWPAGSTHETALGDGAQHARQSNDGCVDDWNNPGGNAARTSRSDEIGPVEASEAFSEGRTSIISWHPVIQDGRVFMVRQLAPPTTGGTGASPVVAMDLESGGELWGTDIPHEAGDWITWIAGVRDGVVYASNSGNGATVSAIVYGLDVADGAVVWQSQDTIDSSAYDGAVFASDGDLIIGNHRSVIRIDSGDGSTVWSKPRNCSLTGSCGVALFGDSVYLVDGLVGGHMIHRHDLATGNRLYDSPLMPGWTLQNKPMVGDDGTIYLSRTQSFVDTDFIYAFTDTGSAFVERWHVPAAWTSLSMHAMTNADQPLFTVPGPEIAVLDPATGDIIASTGVLADFSAPRMAVDGAGTLYLSNRGFATGRLYAFDSNLDSLWDTAVTNINIGGPVIGRAGTVVVCGIGTDVRGYRTPGSVGSCPFFDDGFESGDLTAWSATVP